MIKEGGGTKTGDQPHANIKSANNCQQLNRTLIFLLNLLLEKVYERWRRFYDTDILTNLKNQQSKALHSRINTKMHGHANVLTYSKT